MKMPSIHDIQKELKDYSHKEVIEFCIRLAKYKKENKELLSYLMFDSRDEKQYVKSIQSEIDQLFQEINRQSTYTTKKGLQKVVRYMTRYIRYSPEPTTELEIRIYFCKMVIAEQIDLAASPIIHNLYEREKEKIKKCVSKLHEDLQYDFREVIETL
jgi:membrane-anchored protein YejM (alkaline phosphatase superfamily)